MLGEKALFAPTLRTPLSSHDIQVTPPAGASVEDIKRELETLISKAK